MNGFELHLQTKVKKTHPSGSQKSKIKTYVQIKTIACVWDMNQKVWKLVLWGRNTPISTTLCFCLSKQNSPPSPPPRGNPPQKNAICIITCDPIIKGINHQISFVFVWFSLCNETKIVHMQKVMTFCYQRCPWGNRDGLVMGKPSMHMFNFSSDQLDTWCDIWKSACGITGTTYLEVEIVNVGGINVIVCIKKFFFYEHMYKEVTQNTTWNSHMTLYYWSGPQILHKDDTFQWQDQLLNGLKRLYHIHNFFLFLKVCA